MLRNRQHSMIQPPPWNTEGGAFRADLKTEVLVELVDSLDLYSFLHEPAYRRRLNDVLACFSDEEFDSFERLYTRRFTVN